MHLLQQLRAIYGAPPADPARRLRELMGSLERALQAGVAWPAARSSITLSALARHAGQSLARRRAQLVKQNPLFGLLLTSTLDPELREVWGQAFRAHPGEALNWASYALAYPAGTHNDMVLQNKRFLAKSLLQHFSLATQPSPAGVFSAAYWDEHYAIELRKAFSRWIRERRLDEHWVPRGKLPSSRPLTIALVASAWRPRSAVRRFFEPALEAVKRQGHALLFASLSGEGADGALFAQQVMLWQGQRLDGRALASKKPDVVIFAEPYVGLGEALSVQNRYAPVQLACYGIPITTGSAAVDYFIVGESVENPRSLSSYVEHTVSVPGLAAHYVPDFSAPDSSPVPRRLGVAASQQKWTPALVDALVQARRQGWDVVAFPGEERLDSSLVLGQAATAGVRLAYGLDRNAFLRELAACQLLLDSAPYGAMTTLFDAKAAGTPMTCVEGGLAVGRATAGYLREAGLADLVCSSWTEVPRILARMDQSWQDYCQLRHKWQAKGICPGGEDWLVHALAQIRQAA